MKPLLILVTLVLLAGCASAPSSGVPESEQELAQILAEQEAALAEAQAEEDQLAADAEASHIASEELVSATKSAQALNDQFTELTEQLENLGASLERLNAQLATTNKK